jgi:hypothetical protein
VKDVFGGSSSSSKNQAYPSISAAYGPTMGQFGNTYNALGNILGVNGSQAQSQGLNNYWNSAGGQFQMNQGLDALTSKFSALGLQKSGADMKGMEQYRQGLASTYLNNYLGQLGNLGHLGLGAGSLVADAGQTSNGSSSPGMIQDIAAIAAMASDRRLKTNIEKIGEANDGLGLYRWNWKSNPSGEKITGVIADEVEKLRPWAFVKGFVGGVYDGVNYAALGSLA